MVAVRGAVRDARESGQRALQARVPGEERARALRRLHAQRALAARRRGAAARAQAQAAALTRCRGVHAHLQPALPVTSVPSSPAIPARLATGGTRLTRAPPRRPTEQVQSVAPDAAERLTGLRCRELIVGVNIAA